MRYNCSDQISSTFPIQEACYVISLTSSLSTKLYLEFFQSAQCGLLPGIEFLTRYFGRLPSQSQFVPFQCAPHSRLHTASAVPSSRLFLRARTLSRTASQLRCLLHHARMLLLPTCPRPPACLIRFRQCPSSSSAHVSGHRKHCSASIVDLYLVLKVPYFSPWPISFTVGSRVLLSCREQR